MVCSSWTGPERNPIPWRSEQEKWKIKCELKKNGNLYSLWPEMVGVGVCECECEAKSIMTKEHSTNANIENQLKYHYAESK